MIVEKLGHLAFGGRITNGPHAPRRGWIRCDLLNCVLVHTARQSPAARSQRHQVMGFSSGFGAGNTPHTALVFGPVGVHNAINSLVDLFEDEGAG
jgi:hypothetical protein